MSAFRLACLGYAVLALPASTGGLLWPSIRVSLHQPLGALGGLLAVMVVASVAASVVTGRVLSRLAAGSILATGTVLCGLGTAVDAVAPTVWLFAIGMVLVGLGFGAVDAAFNAYAARRFHAGQITWMHASYGVGATAAPLLVTALLGAAISWRWIFALMAAVQIGLALVLIAGRGAWVMAPATAPIPAEPIPAELIPAAPIPAEPVPARPARTRPRVGIVAGSLAFTMVETGIETAAGVWGYVFLTAGRGLAPTVAGVAVSGYWAMMVVGRIVLGLAAKRLGTGRVLGAAVAGVPVGAALLMVPAPGWLAVAGLLLLGLAAAPIFPLFTLTTGKRLGDAGGDRTTWTVGLQVAASAGGSAAVPAALGLAVASAGAAGFAVPLLALSLAMCAVYGLLYAASAARLPDAPAARLTRSQ